MFLDQLLQNSIAINPFKYVGLDYLLTFNLVLSASDRFSQYSFFTVYINTKDVCKEVGEGEVVIGE